MMCAVKIYRPQSHMFVYNSATTNSVTTYIEKLVSRQCVEVSGPLLEIGIAPTCVDCIIATLDISLSNGGFQGSFQTISWMM